MSFLGSFLFCDFFPRIQRIPRFWSFCFLFVDAKLDDFSVLAASGSLPQNVNYAIKAKVVREFLLKCPEVQLPVSNAALKSEQAVKCAQDAVVMVLIY